MQQVEGGGGIPRVIQTEMILGDYVLAGPRAGEAAGTCHLLYDRLGASGLGGCLHAALATCMLVARGCLAIPGRADTRQGQCQHVQDLKQPHGMLVVLRALLTWSRCMRRRPPG